MADPRKRHKLRIRVWSAVFLLALAVAGFAYAQRTTPVSFAAQQQRDMLIGMRGTNQSVPADYPGGRGTVCSEESFDGTTRRWLCLVWQINVRHLPVLQPPAYAGACTHLLADQQQARWVCLGTDPVPAELPPPPLTGPYA